MTRGLIFKHIIVSHKSPILSPISRWCTSASLHLISCVAEAAHASYTGPG
jgi:hypothetical protein